MFPPITFPVLASRHRPIRSPILARGAAFLLLGALVAGCEDRAPTEPEAAILEVPGGPASQVAPISIESLTDRHAFSDVVSVQVRNRPSGRSTSVANLQNASHMAVLRITIQPGARFPWHTHPGPVLVAVVEGEMTYMYADDCVPRVYPEGSAFVDPGFDNVHAAFNHEDEPMVLVAAFLGVPPEGPLTISVLPAEGDALDARCGVGGAGLHAH